MNIKEIRQEFEMTDMGEWTSLMKKYESDPRSGVQKLLLSCQKKMQACEKENERLEMMLAFEKKYGEEYECICGIDEAGRGPFAGPVVAGAVVLPKGLKIPGLNDSKQVSAKKREELFDIIKEKAVSYGIGMSSPARIDEINILQATYEAMALAVKDLNVVPDLLLNDAVTIPQIPVKQIGIIKGDARSLSIAAASIMAKVTRDHLMEEYAQLYPEYGFEKNKGYGSADHREALQKYGPCPIHRRTFIHNWVKQYRRNWMQEKKTAVALEYETGEKAPKVVASGRGYLADKIVEVAKESDVPVHKDAKLARSLSVLDIGEYIPPELYSVVAEALVFVDNMDRIQEKIKR